MADRPFHHGNLRAVLLDAAEQSLSERGVSSLSLRELAREAGVSHGAPRRHFADRRALLTALAERGFTRVDESMRAAAEARGRDHRGRLQAMASAYVGFAIEAPALLELMFATKTLEPDAGLQAAAERFFAGVREVIAEGLEAGELAPRDPWQLQLLLVSTLQGIATLAGSGRLPAGQVEPLLADAVGLFLAPRRA